MKEYHVENKIDITYDLEAGVFIGQSQEFTGIIVEGETRGEVINIVNDLIIDFRSEASPVLMEC